MSVVVRLFLTVRNAIPTVGNANIIHDGTKIIPDQIQSYLLPCDSITDDDFELFVKNFALDPCFRPRHFLFPPTKSKRRGVLKELLHLQVNLHQMPHGPTINKMAKANIAGFQQECITTAQRVLRQKNIGWALCSNDDVMTSQCNDFAKYWGGYSPPAPLPTYSLD